MQKEPFENDPLTNIFYNSRIHHDAWRYLARGMKKKEPVLFVTGEYGTGKTLLCLKLVKIFINKKSIPFVFIPTPNYSFHMILEKITAVLGISSSNVNSQDEQELLNIIYEYFEKIDNTSGKHIYIIIDEVQDISYLFANKLKLLLSFNCSEHFPFKLIMFGHMNFLEILDRRNLISLRQRIRKIFYLQPFGFNETKEYIYFRLIYSGASGTPVFEDSAIHMIQSASAGIPRLINNICDTCLVEAGRRKMDSIDINLVKAIVQRNLPPEKRNISAPVTHEPVQHIVEPQKNDGPDIRLNTEINQIDPARENILSNHTGHKYTKENSSENEFTPVTENKNNKEKSGNSSLKKIFDKKAGLILILICIVAVLSYILFLQIQSDGIPQLNKKIGENIMKNKGQIVCCDNIKTIYSADTAARYLYMTDEFQYA